MMDTKTESAHRATSPFDPIYSRTTWIYRGILAVLAVMCIALIIQTSRLNENVHELQRNVDTLNTNAAVSRSDRSTYQEDQRELGCQIAQSTNTVSPLCKDGKAIVPGTTQK